MDELERIIRDSREGLGVEFKRSMSFGDSATQGKVVKAALAFANKRDGGILAFGLERHAPNPLHKITGMLEDDYNSFEQDSVSALVNTHATPHIDLSVEHRLLDEKRIVVIVVREFVDYPTICAKDFVCNGRPVVIRGRLYCRSRRMPESTDVQSPEDMRDIIELATAKGLERYHRLRSIERRIEGPKADDQFRDQLKGLDL